jgi:hypothetical protein
MATTTTTTDPACLGKDAMAPLASLDENSCRKTEEARMKNQTNYARHHVSLTLALVGLMCAATLVLGPARLASAQVVYPSWSYTGNLNTARSWHTATLLPNGNVLVAGGGSNTAELFDTALGTWSYTGTLNTARYGQHTATLLPNGKVLVAGGIGNCTVPRCSFPSNAELYDPATGAWSNTGNLNTARRAHTATLLANGKVLVAGGWNDDIGDLSSAELYDPATGKWSYTGKLSTPRGVPTATLLPSGKVLVAGGEGFAADSQTRIGINSAELYDPATGTWSYTGSLNAARALQSATLLPNGKVLIAGGDVVNVAIFNSAELYDPATGTWSATGNLSTPRVFHTETLLSGGKVLIVGSWNGCLNNAELYDPAIGRWSITANLNTLRSDGHTATLLSNGKVLVAGGNGLGGVLNSAELYDPSASPNSNIIDDAQFFVRQQYVDFLQREPDTDGLLYWTNQITQCGSDSRCNHDRRIGVSAAFFIELEFQDTGYYVYRFYKASFGRQPNYAEFNDRSLSCDDCSFADDWVQRDAFRLTYPNTMSNAEFVNKLFDTAGLTASIYETQRQQEIQAMNSGRSRADVLRDLIEIPDFKNVPDPNSPRYSELKQISQYNPAFVLMQYFGYLRRDLDQHGYDFWLDVVNNREPNNYHGMVCAFITSTEYQLRFGSVVTRSNADCGQ